MGSRHGAQLAQQLVDLLESLQAGCDPYLQTTTLIQTSKPERSLAFSLIWARVACRRSEQLARWAWDHRTGG